MSVLCSHLTARCKTQEATERAVTLRDTEVNRSSRGSRVETGCYFTTDKCLHADGRVSPLAPKKDYLEFCKKKFLAFFTSPYITANEISHWVWPWSNKDPYLDFNDCNHCLPFCKLIYFTESHR